MRDENGYDALPDTPNTTFPFEKYVVIAENKDVVLNRKLRYWEWL